MSLSDNLRQIQDNIQNARQKAGKKTGVEMVAVTKTHPVGIIIEATECGITSIGENRVQEAAAKFPLIPTGASMIKKRMVGHLQSNKARKAMDLFDSIDSVDSLKLARNIAARNEGTRKTVETLLEINTSGETTKYGFDPNDLDSILEATQISALNVKGLMTIGPLDSDENKIRSAFASLRNLLENINSQLSGQKLNELSMGMSDDYETAVEEGSTMVRIGTALFGPREK